jgi:hypothetical protein
LYRDMNVWYDWSSISRLWSYDENLFDVVAVVCQPVSWTSCSCWNSVNRTFFTPFSWLHRKTVRLALCHLTVLNVFIIIFRLFGYIAESTLKGTLTVSSDGTGWQNVVHPSDHTPLGLLQVRV